jgi:putative spermidine/putrescine transport system substrate-binding protein
MKKAIVGILLSLIFIVGTFAADPTWAQISKNIPDELNTQYIRTLWEAAIKEGKTIYSYGMPDVWANYGGIFGEFQRIFGIEHSDIDMGSSIVLARMTEENASKNDIADLKPSLASVLADKNLTSDYKSLNWGTIPDNQKGQAPNNSVWQAAYKGVLGFLVNTNLVKKVPKKWQDLADPQYKGLLEYLDPRATGTGVNTIEAVSYAVSQDPYNYQAGIDFMKKLHSMGVVLSVEPKTQVAKFQIGETGILINFDYNLMQWKSELGVPAEVVIPEDGTIASGGAVVMAKNAPHPNTAKLFMEFLFSKYGQSLFYEGYVSPILPAISVPDKVKSKLLAPSEYKNVKFIDYNKDQEVTPKLQEYYNKVIGGK